MRKEWAMLYSSRYVQKRLILFETAWYLLYDTICVVIQIKYWTVRGNKKTQNLNKISTLCFPIVPLRLSPQQPDLRPGRVGVRRTSSACKHRAATTRNFQSIPFPCLFETVPVFSPLPLSALALPVPTLFPDPHPRCCCCWKRLDSTRLDSDQPRASSSFLSPTHPSLHRLASFSSLVKNQSYPPCACCNAFRRAPSAPACRRRTIWSTRQPRVPRYSSRTATTTRRSRRCPRRVSVLPRTGNPYLNPQHQQTHRCPPPALLLPLHPSLRRPSSCRRPSQTCTRSTRTPSRTASWRGRKAPA